MTEHAGLPCISKGQRGGFPWLAGGRRCGNPYHRHRRPTSLCLPLDFCNVLKNRSAFFSDAKPKKLRASTFAKKYRMQIRCKTAKVGFFFNNGGLDGERVCRLTCKSGTLYTPGTASPSAGWAWLRSQDRRRGNAAHNRYRTAGPEGPLQSRRLHTRPPHPL